MRRWRTLVALGCVGSALALAGPAVAAGDAVINDCQSSGKLTQSYTLAQLHHALAVMPPATREYTNCSDVINEAIVAAVGKGSSTGGTGTTSSGGSFLPTPVIIIIVVLLLAAVTFGAAAIRRRRQDGGPGGPSGGGSGGGPAA